MKDKNILKCPKCGESIDVNEVLYKELNNEFTKRLEEMSIENEKKIKHKINEINEEKEKLAKEKEDFEENIKKQVQAKVSAEKLKIEEKIKSQLESENEEQLAELQKELQKKSEQVKDLNRSKSEIEKLKREKDEMKELMELENEKKLTEILREEKGKIKRQADEEQSLKLKEKEKVIENLMDQLNEAKRQAEQGSMQLQGEIQELELENILRELFRFDEIQEVKKGQRGADCLQVVKNSSGGECGKIYYESKRTKDFSNSWIQKLKNDNLEAKADILVLVSQAMPDGEDKYFYKDGVWVCSFAEIKGLAFVLRHGLMQLQLVAVTQHNKDAKMEMLYNYLTSKEFKGQLEAIIEGFSSLQSGYHDEKKKMQKIWAEREKQLEKILTNTITFYGSLRGIAGASIPEIPMLEDNSPLSLDIGS